MRVGLMEYPKRMARVIDFNREEIAYAQNSTEEITMRNVGFFERTGGPRTLEQIEQEEVQELERLWQK